MTNNKKIYRTLGKLALILTATTTATLSTCTKVPENYCADGQPLYNVLTQFCFGDKTESLCGGFGGAVYAPPGEACIENAVVTVCGRDAQNQVSSYVTRGTPCAGYTLTINAVPSDGGTVYLNDAESIGAVAVSPGTHRVEAKPNVGYTFSGWSGATAGTVNPGLLEVDGDKALTATFRRISVGGETTHILIASASPREGGTVFVNNAAQTEESTEHDHGAVVIVHAVAAAGYVFSGWSDGDSTITQQYVTVTMEGGRTLVAMFTSRMYTLTVNRNPVSGGTTEPALIQAGIAAETPFNISASPNSEYAFKNWSVESGDADVANKNDAVTVVTLGSNATITANFQPTYTLTVEVGSYGGSVSPTSRSGVTAGTPVEIRATANNNYAFQGWTVTSGAANATIADPRSAVTTVTLSGNATVTANVQTAHTLTVNVSSSGGGTVYPAQPVSVAAGASTAIRATANSGYEFGRWSVTGGATIADQNSASTTVTMGSSNATVTANFRRQVETSSFTYGGQTYKTVKIGNQWWMAENLNYETDSSWCYENDPYNCGKYGRLYTWNAAKEACSGIGNGWHLPSRGEWNSLMEAVGGERSSDGSNYYSNAGRKLKSTSGWNSSGNGTDDFGFSALPGGRYDFDGSFSNVGYYGYWWSATEGGSGSAYSRYMYYNYDSVGEGSLYRSYGFSARCVVQD